MDDVPAGPASPEPRRPSLSVVVPVRNGGSNFEHCLRRLHESTWTDYELIVVDDGSTDGSGEMARKMGAFVARYDQSRGPAAARNLGSLLAKSDLIFFLDADVAVTPETLWRGMARFVDDSTLTALFGSYDDQPSSPDLVSQFRNLLHHFVHQQGVFTEDSRPAHTFWTGCGIIRRDVFLDFGGFDPRLYPRPAIEDIELGYRLTRAGHRILLARDVQAKHLKRWSLIEMIKTDIFRRGVPWMLLIKRSGTSETDLNVKKSQRFCVIITGIVLLAFPFTVLSPWALLVPAAGFSAMVALNATFYRFLAITRGYVFAVRALGLHFLYYVCCGISVILALLQWHVLGGMARVPIEKGRRARIDRASQSFPGPILVRFARRLARWTTRSR